MYLVLVTNKASNILEDLETLRLCGKVVPEYVMPLEEENVSSDEGRISMCTVRRLIFTQNKSGGEQLQCS